ncbi:unnamed protein product [Blepharisma stoltei]|uniref:50S ribosomal protein L29, chloroplastic n=1 Tax=Blepharisma stoltei TaxID=1481888 RepID=A0AAU9JSW4_9CILI|nr:unnamed protein product [Blepharisma stoltei]
MDRLSILSHEELVKLCTSQQEEIKTLNKKLQLKELKIESLKFKLRRRAFKDPSVLMKEARKLRSEVTKQYGEEEMSFWNVNNSYNEVNIPKVNQSEVFKNLFVEKKLKLSPIKDPSDLTSVPNSTASKTHNKNSKSVELKFSSKYARTPLPFIPPKSHGRRSPI